MYLLKNWFWKIFNQKKVTDSSLTSLVTIPVCSWTTLPIILPTSHMHTFHTNHQLPHTPVDHHLDYKRLTHTPPHCEVLFTPVAILSVYILSACLLTILSVYRLRFPAACLWTVYCILTCEWYLPVLIFACILTTTLPVPCCSCLFPTLPLSLNLPITENIHF